MPCYDSRSDLNSPDGQAELRKSFRHNSDVAELLCYVLTHLSQGRVPPWTNGLNQWWEEHKARDAAKHQQEAAKKKRASDRQKALAKLTAKERRLLGYSK